MASSASGMSPSNPNYGQSVEDHSGAAKFKLSPEEVNVLKECNKESFFYRCLPLGAIAMASAHYAVQADRLSWVWFRNFESETSIKQPITGRRRFVGETIPCRNKLSSYLKGSARFGSLWKVAGAGALGYFLGKFSYRSKCEEKILKLPNSQLAELIRRRTKGLSPFPEIYTIDPSYSAPEGGGRSSGTEHSTPMEYAQGTWEIDSEKNVEYQGLDDSFRPSVDDNTAYVDTDLPIRGSSVSYDSLRQKNRDEFETKRSTPYRQERPAADDQRFANRQEPMKRANTNKYGDSVD